MTRRNSYFVDHLAFCAVVCLVFAALTLPTGVVQAGESSTEFADADKPVWIAASTYGDFQPPDEANGVAEVDASAEAKTSDEAEGTGDEDSGDSDDASDEDSEDSGVTV